MGTKAARARLVEVLMMNVLGIKLKRGKWIVVVGQMNRSSD
jgi:hypothetical protein